MGLSHEIPVALAVVAALFSWLALGAWGLDRRVSTSRAPGRRYNPGFAHQGLGRGPGVSLSPLELPSLPPHGNFSQVTSPLGRGFSGVLLWAPPATVAMGGYASPG